MSSATPSVLHGKVKDRYDWFKQRQMELEHQAKCNDGRLRRQDWWTCGYYRDPYLLLETDDTVRERFVDVFSNTVDITHEGKIAPLPMMMNDGRFSVLFAEVLEEMQSRGILASDVIANATAQIHSYFEDGAPLGVRMFGDRVQLKDKWLVKYSRTQYIEQMYRYGRIRIAPASEYAKGCHIKAVKDFETIRNFRLRALRYVLDGRTEVSFCGSRVPIHNGVIPLKITMGDFYLFSTCRELDRRMPTDFESDAALIIKDRVAFVGLLKRALLSRHPDWEFMEGNVYYYDPYKDLPCDANCEFWKHFSYAYQKEHRCVFKPRDRRGKAPTLTPFFVDIGSMEQISEMVVSR